MWKIGKKGRGFCKIPQEFQKLFTRYPHFVDNFMLTIFFVDESGKNYGKKNKELLDFTGFGAYNGQ